jgi:hypothetical protein
MKKFMLNSTPIHKWVLIVWLIFTTLYTLWGGKQFLVNKVYKSGIETGQNVAINQVITQVMKSECKPISVFAGEKSVEVVNLECLKPDAEAAPVETGS